VQQRLKTLDGVDVDLAEAIVVLVACILAAPVRDGLMRIAQAGRRA